MRCCAKCGHVAVVIGEVTMDIIVREVTEVLRMPVGCHLQKTRRDTVVEMRFICYLLIRLYLPEVTLKEMGEFFGMMDHTSIRNGLLRGNELLDAGDDVFVRKYNECLLSLRELVGDA